MPSIFDSFQQGQKKSEDWKLHFQDNKAIFNSLQDEFVDSHPEAFIMTQEAHRLTKLLGQVTEASKNMENSVHISIVGPQKSGKSTIVKMITRELNAIKKENFVSYMPYNNDFWNLWEENDFSSTKIFFFDDIFPICDNLTNESLNNLVDRSKYETVIVVTIFNSIERHWLQLSQNSPQINLFGTDSFEFLFHKPIISENMDILKKRLEIIGKTNLITKNTLETIVILSLGLPGLALWITRNLILQMKNSEALSELRPIDALKMAEYLGFGPALKLIVESNLEATQNYLSKKEIWPIVQPIRENISGESSALLTQLEKVEMTTKSSKSLLEHMILLAQNSEEVKRSDLQEHSGFKESSLTYQCQKLVKEKIVTYSKDGREVYYKLRSPVKEALENLLFV
ncbi:MAG: ArsR/SmtB family transcription factor [Candidatus Hodarchaeales archaeon]